MLPPERRALLLLLTLAVVGQAVRHFAIESGEPPGQVQLLSSLAAGAPGAQRDSAIRQARPLSADERIDVDIAAAAELVRLPRIGFALAKAIVADREKNGPFAGPDGLDRVPGVGPGLLRALAPHLTFSGAVVGQARPPQSDAVAGTRLALPPSGNPSAFREDREGNALNVNRATAVELEALPGIGPSLARRIVADREARGPFATIEALDRISGIGPALVARLGKLVTAP